MNIVDPILFQCRCQPLALALCAPGSSFGPVTYGRLEPFIHNVGRKAREHALVRGNVVALFIKDPILHAVFILGLTKLGIVTVSSRELELQTGLRVDASFADSSYPADSGRPVVVVDGSWLTGDGSPVDDVTQAAISSDDDLCRIILTSGSTGYPKGVARATRHVSTRVHRLVTAYGNRFPDCSRIFMDVGLSTGIGFTIFVYTLWRGGSLFLHGGGSADILEALSSYRVQAMVASPKSLAEMAELCDRIPAFFGGFDVVVWTGSQMSRALSERVRSRLCANLVCSYGSTEAGVAASAPARVIAATEGAVGYVAPGVTIDIVGPAGESLPGGQEGLVRIRSECVVDGYVGDPESTQQKFRDGGFYPGDVGTITPSGLLVLSGRRESVINLGGDKVSPERVEAVLTAFAPVRDAAAFAVVTQLGVQILGGAIVWRGEADVTGLQEHLRRRLPPIFIPVMFVTVDAIPRNASGKIDRQRLKEIAAQALNEQRLSPISNGDGARSGTTAR
jgi:acyl-coenzyme A synthetase/AMP-(fatty) acid ligase